MRCSLIIENIGLWKPYRHDKVVTLDVTVLVGLNQQHTVCPMH
jgi:hypothetical protein